MAWKLCKSSSVAWLNSFKLRKQHFNKRISVWFHRLSHGLIVKWNGNWVSKLWKWTGCWRNIHFYSHFPVSGWSICYGYLERKNNNNSSSDDSFLSFIGDTLPFWLWDIRERQVNTTSSSSPANETDRQISKCRNKSVACIHTLSPTPSQWTRSKVEKKAQQRQLSK